MARWIILTLLWHLLSMLSAADEFAEALEHCGERDEVFNTSLLQLGTTLARTPTNPCGYLLIDTCSNLSWGCSNACATHSHGSDCYRPVDDVMAEHPGEDGYCYFNSVAFYVKYGGPTPDFEAEAASGITYLRHGEYKGLNTGPLLTYHFEGEVIASHMDSMHYSYDDIYAYSLGFLQGQGIDSWRMKNATDWISLSEEKCKTIQQRYNFSKAELVLSDWLDFNQVIATMACCSAGISCATDENNRRLSGFQSVSQCRPVTRRDFAKHHYMKCLLGYRNSAADMAYLHSRACLLAGHRIGHFSDCPYVPPVDF